jgi:hypothetical protein
MSNPLFQQMGNAMPNNGMAQMIQRFNQFRQAFSGDARQQVQQLLNSGKVSQDDYNRAVQMANQLQRMMGEGR